MTNDLSPTYTYWHLTQKPQVQKIPQLRNTKLANHVKLI